MEMKHLENLIKTPDFHQLREKQKNRSVAPMTLNQRLRALLPRMNSNGEFGRGMILPNGDRVLQVLRKVKKVKIDKKCHKDGGWKYALNVSRCMM